MRLTTKKHCLPFQKSGSTRLKIKREECSALAFPVVRKAMTLPKRDGTHVFHGIMSPVQRWDVSMNEMPDVAAEK